LKKSKSDPTEEKHIWFLYNQEEDIMFEGLTFGEARTAISVFNVEQRVYWYAWREGWSEWKSVTSCYELVATTNPRRTNFQPPPLPVGIQTTKRDKIFQKQESIQKEILPRKYVRYKIRYKIELICNEKSFISFTQDISLGGIKIEDLIPDWVAGYSTLYLMDVKSRKKLEFMSTVVENQKTGDKFRLELLPSADSKNLKEWLEASGAPTVLDSELTNPSFKKPGKVS